MNQKISPPTTPRQPLPVMWPTLSLFASAGTLVCCALPALFVSLGAGAALAGLVSAAPWLVALSKYKAYTFAVSGAMLALAAFMQWRARRNPCPRDAVQAEACSRLRRMGHWLLGGSVMVWLVGFFLAFLAAPLLT